MNNKLLVGIGILGIICVVLMSGCIEELKKEEVTCNKPYIKVGNECCLDKDDNGICDKDEQTIKTEEEKQEEIACNKPYIKVGNDCCLDSDDNGICDKDEGELEEIPNENGAELNEINKSKVRAPFDKAVEIDKTKVIPINETEEDTSTSIMEIKPIKVTGIIAGCTEKRITTNTAAQRYPAIYDDKIVWQDNRNGNADIYMYDLKTNTEKIITTNVANQVRPAIHGNNIVWADERNGRWDIYKYDLTTDIDDRIATRCEQPAIYGDKVVCIYRNTASRWNVFVDNFAHTEAGIISYDEHNNQVLPAIYENKIVWLNNNKDIYLYIESPKRITTYGSAAGKPAIYGGKIVWEDMRSGNWDIHVYDITTNIEKRITTNVATQRYPAIYEDKIVWQDNRNGNWDIYQYDISTNTEKRITTNNANQMYPAIYEDKIVWQDNRNGNDDIYVYSC